MRAGAEALPITRRRLIAAAAAGLSVAGARLGAAAAQAGEPPATPPPAGPPHAGPPHATSPTLGVPVLTENGAKVPIVVQADHPMEPGHHVIRVAVDNPRDPIPSKGQFLFSPANGQAYVAFQARLDDGASLMRMAVECSRGHRWGTTQATRVVDGAGGCAGEGPRPARVVADPRPPMIRIPRQARGERIEAGQIVDVQVSIQHPVRTGLERRGDGWAQVSEPFYLTEMEVFLGGERVSRFLMTPAVSDNPLIAFRLRPYQDSAIAVVFRNSRGGRFEAEQRLRLG